MSDCPTCAARKRAASAPAAYRRALWAVALLNLGQAVVEMTGGFLSGSEALKADALDFLGDGLITGLGLALLGGAPRLRARAALAQGAFLALMGLAVLGWAAWRAATGAAPEAGLMGGFGLLALGVNLLCAVLLLRHREGDAAVRAVWLFSRNDALSNIGVIAAAGAVALTGAAWPDLLAAAIIALLFLHSAGEILRDARAELRAAEAPDALGQGS